MMRRLSLPLLPLTAALLLAAACGSTGQTVESTPDLADQSAAPADVESDSALPGPDADVPPEDLVELRFPEDAEDAGPDLAGPACDPGEGCFLDKCDENADCQSGWCVEHMGEGVCSQLCQEECPPGWACKQVGAGGPDVTWVCVSAVANLCKPCATTEGCMSPGGAQDVCVDYGDQGSFCGGACLSNEDCPWGFHCGEAVTVDGISTSQCIAETGSCPCTSKSIALALTTPCAVTNDFGTCVGKRVCTDLGLTECDAATPALEECNGIDDDCDGDVDEPAEVGGDYVNLCDDGNECTQDVCAGEAGCTYEDLSEGECKDGDSCTVGDHCDGGVCVGNPVLCDDKNPCTDDSCDGVGGCLFLDSDVDCDDGNACTVADECFEGECVGVSVNCECQQDSDCAAFDDGNACNGTLICSKEKLPYQCKVDPATVITCAEPVGPEAVCLQALCDPTTGKCGTEPAHEGYACDSGNPCTVGDKCVDGVCTPGVAVGCNDGNPCTDDSCNDAEGCLHTPNNAACSDDNACTLGDHCEAGTCAYNSLLSCDDGNVCTNDSCDPKQGCSHKLNTAPCTDGNVCTTGDHCHLGECISSGTLSCDDGNPCTIDSCNPAVGCAHGNSNEECDDGNPCTTGDHCANGGCVFDGFKDCNDGLICNGPESCDPTIGCKAGPAPLLDDGIKCTFDYCDEAEGGVVHAPVDESCNDGLWCNGVEKCNPQTGCVPGTPVVVDDAIPCTVDICDEENDVVKHLADHDSCQNANVCDGTESCVPAQDGCVAGTPLSCNDQVGCTVDSCDPVAGCKHAADDGACDDANVCTVDGCDLVQGCLHIPEADGTACVTNGAPGTCEAGQCVLACQPGSQTFNFTGNPESFTLPQCATTTTVEAWGAKGGNEESGIGGNGAYMKCRLQGLAGKTLEIRVGKMGETGTCGICGGGGGGGSFVREANANTPLTIAGGGGGASYQGDHGQPGLTTEQGGPGGYMVVSAGQGGYTDNGGGGGCGAGGGGWNTDGLSNSWATGGKAKGGAGGISDYMGHGGFGGGGAAFHGGGGGGGYSGGSGGTYPTGAGGGGSYCSGDKLDSASGTNATNGKIVISWQ